MKSVHNNNDMLRIGKVIKSMKYDCYEFSIPLSNCLYLHHSLKGDIYIYIYLYLDLFFML